MADALGNYSATYLVAAAAGALSILMMLGLTPRLEGRGFPGDPGAGSRRLRPLDGRY